MTKPVLPYATNTHADQPMHPRSLISISVIHSVETAIPADAISEISRL